MTDINTPDASVPERDLETLVAMLETSQEEERRARVHTRFLRRDLCNYLRDHLELVTCDDSDPIEILVGNILVTLTDTQTARVHIARLRTEADWRRKAREDELFEQEITRDSAG